MEYNIKVWRQKNAKAKGHFETYHVTDVEDGVALSIFLRIASIVKHQHTIVSRWYLHRQLMQTDGGRQPHVVLVGYFAHILQELIVGFHAPTRIVTVYLYLFDLFHVVGLVHLNDTLHNLLCQPFMFAVHAVLCDIYGGHNTKRRVNRLCKTDGGIGHGFVITHDHIEVATVDFLNIILF
jgi:hypothetical protein